MSGAYCAVPGCGNKQYKTVHTNPEIKYYYFPKVDTPRRKHWLKFCNKPPKFKGYVCSIHFREEDFRQYLDVIDDPNFKRRLLPSAIPSIKPKNFDEAMADEVAVDYGDLDEPDALDAVEGVEEDEDDDDLSSSLVERLSAADMDQSNPPPTEESIIQPQKETKDYKTDSDGFRLEFDPDIPEDERKFYMRKYPTVNVVYERKIHCTVCCDHMGTAPAQESIIRMHPVLKVTHCKKCHDFYNSGEFSKGEDGSELYCRWCGQGGQVYCCAKCPFVFCYSCISNNLGKDCVRDIEENENWNCFACAPKIMWHLRAQHWALMNFIEKQKQSILSGNHSDSEIKRLMIKDMTLCCKTLKRPKSSASGRFSDVSEPSDSELSLSEIRKRTKRSTPNNSPLTLPSKKTSNRRTSTPVDKRKLPKLTEQPNAKKIKINSNDDQVVCTPDVLSMLQNNASPSSNAEKSHGARNAQSSTPQHSPAMQRKILPAQKQAGQQQLGQPQVVTVQTGPVANVQANAQQPPPLIIRNFNHPLRAVASPVVSRKTIVGARPPTTSPSQSPVYHTINGFRIDLNSAAQQETFRLPNGKLIQVKKQGLPGNGTVATTQTTTSATTAQQITLHNTRAPANQRGVQNITVPANIQTQGAHHYSITQPSLATIRYATATTQCLTGTTTITAPSGTVIGQLLNGTPNTTVQAITTRPAQNSGLVRQFFSATPLGQARTQLQNQVFSAMEICQHLTGKILTLTNSNAYKSVGNYNDVKELYIHLSYLFTYAIGRFKALQEKCTEDMRILGFDGDVPNLESGQLGKTKFGEKSNSEDDDDDIEIVEPKTTLIDLDSDEEENGGQSSNKASSTSPIPVAVLLAISPTPSVPLEDCDNSMPEGNLELSELSTSVRAEPKKPRTKITNIPNPHLLKKQEDQRKLHDPKLKSTCSIVLDRVEDVNKKAKSLLEEISKDENYMKDVSSQNASGERANSSENHKYGGSCEEVQEVIRVFEDGAEDEEDERKHLVEVIDAELEEHEDSQEEFTENDQSSPEDESQDVDRSNTPVEDELDDETPPSASNMTPIPSVQSVSAVKPIENPSPRDSKTNKTKSKTVKSDKESKKQIDERESLGENVQDRNVDSNEDDANTDPSEYSEREDETFDGFKENKSKPKRMSVESDTSSTSANLDRSRQSLKSSKSTTNGKNSSFSGIKRSKDNSLTTHNHNKEEGSNIKYPRTENPNVESKKTNKFRMVNILGQAINCTSIDSLDPEGRFN